MWWLALACVNEDPIRQRPPTVEPSTPEPAGASITPWVALPYATVGDDVDVGVIRVRAGDDGGEVTVGAPTGDFAVDAGVALGPGEVAELEVRYTGPTTTPRIATGAVRVALGGLAVDVGLAAVLGDPALPEVAWTTDALGTLGIAALPSAPFPGHDVWVFLPATFDDGGAVCAVTHLHGHYSELVSTVPRQGWIEQHAASGRDAILLIPQGPVYEASGDFGALEADGGHARLLRDAVSALYRDGLVERPALGAQLVSSHSGGYGATAAFLDHGGLPIDGVYLYDSVYGYVDAFRAFGDDGGVLFSNYTATGGTDANNRALRDALRADGVTVWDDFRADHLLGDTAAIGATDRPHDTVMLDGRVHERWLRAGPLPRSARAAPTLSSVVVRGGTADLRWWPDRVPSSGVVVVEGSDDGVEFRDLASTSSDHVSVPATAFVRLRGESAGGERGAPSSTYGGSGGGWLVVDGFHRVRGGSWTEPTHDFAARMGAALGASSSASDDAVADGSVALADFDGVVWLLGDESTADVTLDDDAAAALLAYVDGGGHLLISGAELGFATDPALLGALGVDFVADDAGSDTAGGFAFGEIYPEDYPDVLAGDRTIWTYDGGGGAAVAAGSVVAVGFGLETMSDATLRRALPELLSAL